ncbi:hypothetical protein RJ639_015811, partial [Escallonia herrerae]
VLISIDVTFDKFLMLSKKEELINAGKDHGAREKVELEESNRTYELVEVSTGGKLSRHNADVRQIGADTDLQSRIVLDHPRGVSRQVHKCIVAHSLGETILDGNVQVNRYCVSSVPSECWQLDILYAQQTDAGQLTRSLLLVPRASVNVKPNLQIIADDVKCSHGAAITDLEESQLFYFQPRGADLQTARKALIFSFGAEVKERFPNTSTRKNVESHQQKWLEPTLRLQRFDDFNYSNVS